jgi:hypothetical protein
MIFLKIFFFQFFDVAQVEISWNNISSNLAIFKI